MASDDGEGSPLCGGAAGYRGRFLVLGSWFLVRMKDDSGRSLVNAVLALVLVLVLFFSVTSAAGVFFPVNEWQGEPVEDEAEEAWNEPPGVMTDCQPPMSGLRQQGNRHQGTKPEA